MSHQRPAILPWFLNLKWRPSFRWYGHITRYRPAAGLLLDTPHGHCRKTKSTMRKRAQTARVNLAANVVLIEQRLITLLVLLLHVIEKRTACRHQLQEAAA